MRVLFMVFHFPPISGGGVVVVVDIANTLAQLGHEVTVITPNLEWNGKKYEPEINPNIQIIRTETPSKSNLKVAARRCQTNLKKIGEKIGKEKKFDFVLTIFHPFHLVPNAALSCAKKLGIPLIIKVDDAVYEKSSGLKSIQRKIEKIIISKSLHGAAKILVSNEETRKLLGNFYKISKEKISIVPNGVKLSIFKSTQQKEQRKVVFSGVMYHHRGLDVLLESASKIVKKIPDVKFVLLGEGPEMKRLQSLVKEKKLDSNVEFTGWIDRKNIPSYLSDASIGIGPLKLTDVTSKALPIKVLEYMASSLPIIAKKGTLPDDVLVNENNGFFIDNVSELVEKIILLLEDQILVKKMGSESLRMVQKFSWKNVINSILDIFKSI